jgi:hypothetical protein
LAGTGFHQLRLVKYTALDTRIAEIQDQIHRAKVIKIEGAGRWTGGVAIVEGDENDSGVYFSGISQLFGGA